MIKSMRLSCVALLLLFSGCAQVAQPSTVDQLRLELQQIQDSLDDTGAQVTALFAERSISSENIDIQLDTLNDSIDRLDETVNKNCPVQTAAAPEQQCTPTTNQSVVVAGEGKMLLGEVERVWVDPPGLQMIARIDTGASSSSLDANNITSFERDGDDWVRFDVSNSAGEQVTIERPVEKYVRVFQQADKSGSRRPVVDLRLVLGDVRDTFSFTLADRSHLEQGMILGRNFLTDVALVDVSKQHVQPPFEPAKPAP
jgi:hypothetical protein